ncbi:hypothetical protein GmHk_05G013388 [Glycine max]|nr:hypothetical protein GmHk_05G013388 [Glycine max]
MLAIRQLGYPMRGAPTEESMSPFLVRDLGAQNSKTIQRIHKAWETPLRKDQELRGIRNGIIGGYHEWLKVRIRGLDWLAKLKVVSKENFEAPEEDKEVQALKGELGKAKLAKEKFKLAATHVRKECAGLREENAITARALEQETKRARKEEYGRNKFRGALWGSNSELKLRREERDQSRAHSMVLKEELIACSRSKRSLSQHLCETETNMLAIIAKYEEELGLATAHEHRIADEYAQVYAEKEARGRVIDSLHQEATMWMDRFALTLNGSQELPRLLAKAKAMADTYSTPEEIHGLLGYCQHMIDLMAHIIRNLIVAAISAVAKINPMLPSGLKQMNHPTSNMDVNNSTPILIKSQQPQSDHAHVSRPMEETHEIPHHDLANFEPCLGYAAEGQAVGGIPLQNTLEGPQYHPQPQPSRSTAVKNPHDYGRNGKTHYRYSTMKRWWAAHPQSFADLVFASERINVGPKRGKFDHPTRTTEKTGANKEGEDEGETNVVTAIPVRPSFPPTQQYLYSANNKLSPYPPPSYPQRPSLNQPRSLSTALPMTKTTFSTNQKKHTNKK